jgi:hypothetical protein
MTRREGAYPERARPDAGTDERWKLFIAFWLLGGATLVTIGIAMFAGVAHSHRLAALLIISGLISLAIGLFVRRAGSRAA